MATIADVLEGREPWSVETGDCLESLRQMPDGCVQCCVTSPPYYALRDYGDPAQIGLERTPEEYVAKLVAVFAEVRRVLHPTGVFWLNIGDSYARGNGSKNGQAMAGVKQQTNTGAMSHSKSGKVVDGCKDKDLVGIPWMLAFALRSDGWHLRAECLWCKSSPMPESVRDRPTRAHEQVFLLAKRPAYYYDQEAERVPLTEATVSRERAGYNAAFASQFRGHPTDHRHPDGKRSGAVSGPTGRNLWTYWTDIPAEPFPEAHFACFPPSLPSRCIRLGTSQRGCCPSCGTPHARTVERTKLRRERPNDLTKRTGEAGTGNHCGNTVAGVGVRTTGWEPACDCPSAEPVPCVVLDPFCGSGTSGMVARQLGRRFVGLELNPEYAEMSRRRIGSATPLDDACFRATAASVTPDKTLFDHIKEEDDQC